MAGYLGTKAVLLSTTAADVVGNAEIGGDLTVGGAFTSQGIDDNASATAMTLDASGNLLVGTTDDDPVVNNVDGVVVKSGRLDASNNGIAARFNRQASDGDIMQFRKDGSTVGSIGVTSPDIYIGNSGGSGIFMGGSRLSPMNSLSQSDNTIDLGHPSYRWQDVYASNGTIQTSDRNEKQDIDVLSDAEQRVAVSCKGLLRKFRWKDAVAEKGDDARIHFGIIAQDLQDAFTAEGLDAGRYAMFISSPWWEATETYTDDDGVEQTRTNTYETQDEAPAGATERTRLGVRYPELLAFIIGAM